MNKKLEKFTPEEWISTFMSIIPSPALYNHLLLPGTKISQNWFPVSTLDKAQVIHQKLLGWDFRKPVGDISSGSQMPWPRPLRWGFTEMADLERWRGWRHDAFLAKELETCPLKMASKNEVFKHLSLEQVVVPMLVGGGHLHFNLSHWRAYGSRTSWAGSVCNDLGGEPLASSLQLAQGRMLCSVSLLWKDTFIPVVHAQGLILSSPVCFWVSWGMFTYHTLCELSLRALNTQSILYTPSLMFYLTWFIFLQQNMSRK